MKDPKAQQRALLIMQVQAGVITATEAARALGISRKTYYQWEARALHVFLRLVHPGSRPALSGGSPGLYHSVQEEA